MQTKNAGKPSSTVDVLIGATTQIDGDTVFCGGLRIDGKVTGDVIAEGEGTSTLVLSEHAEVVGNVTVPHVVVAGKLRGNVHCSEQIVLLPTAEVTGEVHYKEIEITPGATVAAKLRHDIGVSNEEGTVTKLRSR
jgi:cytoskeletal protein CcmA (bactofilin family)